MVSLVALADRGVGSVARNRDLRRQQLQRGVPGQRASPATVPAGLLCRPSRRKLMIQLSDPDAVFPLAVRGKFRSRC
jgi:hypothetical protein